LIDSRPAAKICMERGCCKFVKQVRPAGDEDKTMAVI